MKLVGGHGREQVRLHAFNTLPAEVEFPDRSIRLDQGTGRVQLELSPRLRQAALGFYTPEGALLHAQSIDLPPYLHVVRLGRSCKVTGFVTDDREAPIEGATVSLQCRLKLATVAQYRTRTGANGFYELQAFTGGAFELQASHPRFVKAAPQEIVVDADRRVDLRLQPAAYVQQFVIRGLRDGERAELRIFGPRISTRVPVRDGRAELGLPRETYLASIKLQDRDGNTLARLDHFVVGSENPKVISVQQKSRVEFEVRAAGKVNGAKVMLVQPGLARSWTVVLVPPFNGKLAVILERGRYTLVCCAIGHRAFARRLVIAEDDVVRIELVEDPSVKTLRDMPSSNRNLLAKLLRELRESEK